MEKRLKKFPICAGLLKKFVVCVCTEENKTERKINLRSNYEENCNLCKIFKRQANRAKY